MGDERVLAPFGRRAAVVIACRREGAYVVLQVADPDGPRPAAGQFYMLSAARHWGGGESERPFLPRAFSVLRAPSGGDRLEFMLEAVGPGTRVLGELAPEDRLLLMGPLGNGFTAPAPGRRALLVGGGVGVAPLAIWQDELTVALGEPPPVLLGFRDAHHALGAGLVQNAVLATDDGSAGHHGLVTELLEAALDRDAGVTVYACGPPGMLEAVRALCAAREVPAQLALESGMACGFGACFGCVVPTRAGYVRLCVDGPVLEGGALESALVAGAGH